jgi:hypothetical protein
MKSVQTNPATSFFRQIFGIFPLAALRQRVATAGIGPSTNTVTHAQPISSATEIARAIELQPVVDNVNGLDPRELLAFYAERTSGVTRQIYSRAGVYLMVGVMIAFSGLAFFYLRSQSLPQEHDYVDRALTLAPGFGVLFFIEFVAFFFLRQYRLAMEEFRYFDAVRRRREENLGCVDKLAHPQTD